MNFDLRKYVLTILLTALIWVMALTPLGYIPLFGVDITLMCIPVILGTCVLGIHHGFFLGLMFAMTSLFMALMGRAGALLEPVSTSSLSMYVTIFVPRLLIPITTWFTLKITAKWNTVLSYCFSVLAGSLTNTVFFLGFVFAFDANLLSGGHNMTVEVLLIELLEIASSNGLLEAAVAVVICVPLSIVFRRILDKHADILEG